MEIRAEIKEITYTGKHEQIISFKNLGKKADTSELTGELIVEVKPYRKRRSRDANAYAWVLMDKISAVTGVEKSQVYRSYVKEIGGASSIILVRNDTLDRFIRDWQAKGIGWQAEAFRSVIDGYSNVIVYEGSSVFDTAQMSRLIELIVAEAKALNIETLTPEEQAKMIDLWRIKQ